MASQLNEQQADFVPVMPTDDKPSMGDAEFVDGLVRQMFTEALAAIAGGKDPPAAITRIAQEWGTKFRADNPAYTQTWDQDAQDTFLKDHGLGTNDNAPGDPVLALVAETLRRFVTASNAFHDGQATEADTQFAIDAAAEDCVALLRGLENPAD